MPPWPCSFLSADEHRVEFPCDVYRGAKLLGYEVIIASLALRDNIRLFAKEIPPIYALLVVGDNSCWSTPYWMTWQWSDLRCFTVCWVNMVSHCCVHFYFCFIVWRVIGEGVAYRATVFVSKGSWIMGNPPNFVEGGEGQQAGEEGDGFRIMWLPSKFQPRIPDQSKPPCPSQDVTHQPPRPFRAHAFHWVRSLECLEPKGAAVWVYEASISPAWEMTAPSLSRRKKAPHSPTQLHISNVNSSERRTSARGFWGGVRGSERASFSPITVRPQTSFTPRSTCALRLFSLFSAVWRTEISEVALDPVFPLPAGWLWAGDIPSLLICKVGARLPTSQWVTWPQD